LSLILISPGLSKKEYSPQRLKEMLLVLSPKEIIDEQTSSGLTDLSIIQD